MTLLELVVATALLALLFGGSFAMSSGTSGAFASATDEIELTERASRGADAVVAALRGGFAPSLTAPGGLPATGDVTEEVGFQRVEGYDAVLEEIELSPEESIAFAADPGDPQNGKDDDGDGLIDEGRVVWTVDAGGPDERRQMLCRDVLRIGAGEIAGNGKDDDGDGVTDEPGFAVVWGVGSVEVQLAVGFRSASGDVLVRSSRRSLAFRN